MEVERQLTPRPLKILCFNGGSSSLKFALFLMEERESMLVRGAIEGIGIVEGRWWVQLARGERSEGPGRFSTHLEAAECALQILKTQGFPTPTAIGHRIVHGGMNYTKPQRVNASVTSGLRKLIPLAPLHLPNELAVIQGLVDRFPEVPQVVCFDTAFHRALPELAQRFPIPRNLWDDGIRRYGFHGLSYEYVLGSLGPASHGRTIIAHLGNGASLVALKDGRPMDTTMGLTPIGGVMMGTRSGDLDPGVLLYLMREKGYDVDDLDRVVQREAGLLGVSQVSSDMKTLIERRGQDARVSQAVAMFCYSIRKCIGALAAVLGGLDMLVFTGGIGERAASVRWEICEGLEHLGVRLDERRNASHADAISAADSQCAVRVISKYDTGSFYEGSDHVIFAVPAGHYEEAVGPRKVTTDLDGIWYEIMEKGAILYYWKSGRYRELVTSD